MQNHNEPLSTHTKSLPRWTRPSVLFATFRYGGRSSFLFSFFLELCLRQVTLESDYEADHGLQNIIEHARQHGLSQVRQQGTQAKVPAASGHRHGWLVLSLRGWSGLGRLCSPDS